MHNEIINSMLTGINANWVCDENIYQWRGEFLDTYFSQRYYFLHEALDLIDNDAHYYIHMVKKIYEYSFNNQLNIDITNPLELFNWYYYLTARDIIYYDNNIQDKIREVRRIQEMEILVPVVLDIIPIYPVKSTVMEYISTTF